VQDTVSLFDSGLPEPPVVTGSPFLFSARFKLPQCCFGMFLADQCAAAPVELDADRRFTADITGFFHRRHRISQSRPYRVLSVPVFSVA